MKVWFKLVQEDKVEDTATKVQLGDDADIDDLRKAVKAECSPKLDNVASMDLVVYGDLASWEEKQEMRASRKLFGLGKEEESAVLVAVPYEASVPSDPHSAFQVNNSNYNA